VFVLDLAEVFSRDLAVRGFCASFEDSFRTEERTDMVGAVYASWERHCGWFYVTVSIRVCCYSMDTYNMLC
jgi:hypothetical protein